MNQPSPCNFRQNLVDQQPVYEKKAVPDKRSKVLRPSIKKKNHKPKWL